MLSFLGLAIPQSQPQLELRVLTYNIHHVEGEDGRFDYERIAGVIRETRPHLVALQEVDRGTGRSDGIDQAARLGELLGMESRFGAAMPYDGGEYGEAILSALPILSTTNHPVPSPEGHEPRAALEVNVAWQGTRLRFVGTHLSHESAATRELQTKALVDLLVGDGATILAGDLNDEPQTQAMKTLYGAGWKSVFGDKPANTYPSDDPIKCIDYILLRSMPDWEVVERRVIDERVASDHRPVLAVLKKR